MEVEFRKYRRKGWIEMRPYVFGEDLTNVSVSDEDEPREGGFIARNPKKPEDMWYVNRNYADMYYERIYP